ncbi:hypothetical protein KPL71_018801 [Citrus sinensis]|uniref:Uncharacterized protein n=1 Tax=Citrus sinensis TaxID=2711 RepID=A0ACB8K0B0_CITSI|nr:hypothetical protein KPL71_018801 [Citrus sinensis]
MGKKYYQRNQFLFNQRTVDSVRILQDIKVRAEEIQSLNNSPLVVGTRKIERWITWKQPIWPWCKLNTDGASKETGASSFCSVTVAELWGLYQDLICTNEYTPLIRSIKNLIKRDWTITINHVYRKANFAADFLTNYALELPFGLHLFSNPPLEIVKFITNDLNGVAYSRYILS